LAAFSQGVLRFRSAATASPAKGAVHVAQGGADALAAVAAAERLRLGLTAQRLETAAVDTAQLASSASAAAIVADSAAAARNAVRAAAASGTVARAADTAATALHRLPRSATRRTAGDARSRAAIAAIAALSRGM